MFLSFPFALASVAEPTSDALTKIVELIALHGVYALLAIFLFIQQRRTLNDAKTAKPEDHDTLMKIYKQTILATYVLMAIAIPIWVFATFFYQPETEFRGDVANLTQMAGTPQHPGEVYVDQQVTPEQRDVDFYVNSGPDPFDPTKVMVKWALVETGKYSQVTLVLSHHYAELVPVGTGIALDPNDPGKPSPVNISKRKKFVVKLSTLSAAQKNSFDFHYDPDPSDPLHTIGSLRLLRNGASEPVPLQDAAAADFSAPPQFEWFALRTVYAQSAAPALDANGVNRMLPLLGSKDLKSQLAAEQSLAATRNIPWESVRGVLSRPNATGDHALLVHNLARVISEWSAKGIAVPADVRLQVAKDAYSVSDFKTAAPLFNGLNDAELGPDTTTWYSRGVANLQTGNTAAATRDLTTYAAKAPTPAAKAVAQRTLAIAQSKK